MKTHFNLSPAEYDASRRGAVEHRRGLLVRQAIDEMQSRVTHVVELGCGPGRFLAGLAADYADLHFTGIDVDRGMIEYARRQHQRPNIEFHVRDIIRQRTGRPAQFVFSIDVLHHVHQLGDFAQAVAGLVEPGGAWLSVEPNIFHPYILWSQERMRRAGFDEDHFRPWVVEPLLRRAGFTIASRSYVSIFPGTIRSLPRVLSWLEQRCENCRFLGGSVVYRLVAAQAACAVHNVQRPVD